MMKIIDKIINFIASIPHDKLLHLFAGYVISNIFNNLYDGIFTVSYWGIIIGFIAAFVIGIAKEIYDYYTKPKESSEIMDFVCTICGGFISSLVSLLLLI